MFLRNVDTRLLDYTRTPVQLAFSGPSLSVWTTSVSFRERNENGTEDDDEEEERRRGGVGRDGCRRY
jgi:hypothetical protein